MKLFSIALIAFVGFSSGASAEVDRIACLTSPLTTSYVLTEHENGFVLRAIQHNGVEYMPIHEGLITARDLQTLTENARVLNGLGADVRIEFKKDECRVDNRQGQTQWICSSQLSRRIGKVDVKGIWFKLSPRRVVTRLLDYTSYRADFSVTAGNMSYSSPMEYSTDACIFKTNP